MQRYLTPVARLTAAVALFAEPSVPAHSDHLR
jgi:hypothetical protein